MTTYHINKKDIISNYQILAAQTSATVVPMLKADGYGLGAQRLVEILESTGVNRFAFSRMEEALDIETDSEIWVLSCYHDEQHLKPMLVRGFTVAVDSLEQCKLISRIASELNVTAKVHVAMDTGFGRFGFLPEQIDDIVAACRLEHICAEGIFSHLGAAFFYKDDFADRQLEIFLQVIGQLEQRGITFALRHIANSSALLRDKKFHLDVVRVGSALLGRLPVAFDLPLKRVGSLTSPVIDIRTLKKGHNIGYGKVYRLKRDTKVAVLAVGSADGVQLTKAYDAFRFRDLCRYGLAVFKMMLKKDNRMYVTLGGKRVPVLGRVALTHTMIDVTDVECSIGDVAEIPISPLYVSGSVLRSYEE